jgi:hypothetical protein
MSLSPDEAAKALDEIAAAERVSRAAYDYLIGGAYLMVCGVIWLICFGLIDLARWPPQLIWIGGCAAGILASVVLGRSRHRAAGQPRWRAIIPSGSYVAFAFLAWRSCRRTGPSRPRPSSPWSWRSPISRWVPSAATA